VDHGHDNVRVIYGMRVKDKQHRHSAYAVEAFNVPD
jgi:hypothetical protein